MKHLLSLFDFAAQFKVPMTAPHTGYFKYSILEFWNLPARSLHITEDNIPDPQFFFKKNLLQTNALDEKYKNIQYPKFTNLKAIENLKGSRWQAMIPGKKKGELSQAFKATFTLEHLLSLQTNARGLR